MDILENNKYVSLNVTAEEINDLVNYRDQIKDAAESANQAKIDLEKNTRFILNGNDADNSVKVFKIDSELSSDSINPIQNCAVANEINRLESIITAETVVNMIYPVGSIYFSTQAVTPSNIFPNTEWEFISTTPYEKIIPCAYKRIK